MIASALAERRERDARVALAHDAYPDVWERIREACAAAADRFDVDDHAALIVLQVTAAWEFPWRPYERYERSTR